nr:hypothetical protein [Tanacetum cinerariifolium]
MATTIEQQVELDEVLVPSIQRCPFFKAFLGTADVPEIYMQEFWAIAYVHQHSIKFKLDNKKHIVNLETFRDVLHICPRIHGQSFDELSFKEEILDFLRFLGHSAQIRTLTDVNVNKLFQPWRSFGTVINKCLTGKSSGFDSFRISQAQILWGLYHKRNIDYAFLIWEDFVYQVEHKNHKKSNEMYYPRFTKVIIYHFMSKDLSIPRRNKVNWHYVRDDNIFSTIKVVSRHQNTQQYGAMLPIELTNEEIRNSKAYKEYYACATGEVAPKPKASARRKKSGSDTYVTPPTAITTPTTTGAVTPRLTAAAKGKQPAKAKSPSDPSKVTKIEAQQLKIVLRRSRQETHISQLDGSGTDEGTGSKPGVLDVPSDDSEEEISWNSSDDEDADTQEKNRDDDEGDEKDKSDDGEKDDDDDERDDDDEKEIAKTDEQDDVERGGDDDEKTENSEDDGNSEEDQGLRISEEERLPEEEEADELYRDVDINQGRGLQLSQDIEDSYVTLTLVHSDGQQESSSVSSQFVSNMLNPTSDAADLSEIELKKILIEKMEGNKSIQRSDKQRNLYKALVEAYEADKIILDTYGERVILKRRRDDDQGEGPSARSNRGSKRQREGKEPESASAPLEPTTRSTGRSTTGSKSRQASTSESAFAEEHVQTTSQIEEPLHLVFETGAEDQPIVQLSQHPEWFSQPKKPPTPDRNWNKTLPASQGSTQSWISDLAKQADSCFSFNELLELEYHLWEVYKATTDQLDWVNPEGQQYPHNLLQPLPLISDNRGRRVILFAHFINNDLEYLWGGASSRKYTTSVTKTKAADYGHIKMFTRSIVIQRRVKDLQLGVESYQKRFNHTKPDTYRSDLKHREAYTAYSNPRGFIYQNKYKKNRLMRIGELHKFSDGTLNDVRNALDDRLKGIRMQYLPQTIWRKGDKDRAAAMIQAIDKMLKTRRIMRSLERFVGGRLEIVTYWFTHIVLSALRRFDNENMLSLKNLILRSILTDLQVTPTKPG